MGPHNACSYADLAMTTIDHKILDTNNRPNDIIFPPDWSRFRDDCFSPWFGGIPALLEFTEWLNSLSDSIKFTVKYSEVQLVVLDRLLFIINGRIESRVYFKPTDGHIYLLPQGRSLGLKPLPLLSERNNTALATLFISVTANDSITISF